MSEVRPERPAWEKEEPKAREGTIESDSPRPEPGPERPATQSQEREL